MLLVAQIMALYLSWYGDPTSTMTIHWHTPRHITQDKIYLENEEIDGHHANLGYLNVHTVHLENLKPDQEYQFRIGRDQNIYRFRTAPVQGPLRFVIGGDADYSTYLFRKMNQTIVEKDPLFCVIGGDIAYAVNIGFFRNPRDRWLEFLSIWKEQMMTESGRLIPLVLGIGNHDINPATKDLFFTLFPFPEKHFFRTLDFGNCLSLFLLDTNHFSSIYAQQTDWLEKSLSSRQHFLYRFAVYHEAAFPSYYPYDGEIPQQIRSHWSPLFENYNLTAAFENHNHTFKRTYPMNGVVYLGDGCWGAIPRKTKDLWYLQKRGSYNHIYLIDVTKETAHIQAINLKGEPIDEINFSSFPQMDEHL